MRKIKLFFTCFFAFTMVSFTEEYIKLSWNELQNVKFKKKYTEEVKGNIDFPDFPPNIKKMEGKRVKVTGYIIPWDETGASVAISARPDKSCFFCTNANPLSVMDVELKNKKQRFKVDDYTTFIGTLELNDSDIHQLFYVLHDGVAVKQ